MSTISGTSNLIEGSERANIMLLKGTRFHINDALYFGKSIRNLLSFKDICRNGYHIEIMNDGNKECLYITSIVSSKKLVGETLSAFSTGLYNTTIKPIEPYIVVNQKFNYPNTFVLWHDRLGHPGSSIMRRIIENSQGHEFKNQNILLSYEYPCVACSQGKLIVRPSHTKVKFESPIFLERVHGGICGPVHPPCGPFWYFMVLIDAPTRWSHVCLLATHNIALSRLLAQIAKLWAQFPDYPIKSIILDNAGEFTSQTLTDYCMSVGIIIKHPVAHTHTQNGLAESLIKRLQLIARLLLMKTKLPTSAWGHAIMHAANLVHIRPVASPKLDLTRSASPNRNPEDARLIFIFYILLSFLFQKYRDLNPWPDPNGRSESEPGLLRRFFYLSY